MRSLMKTKMVEDTLVRDHVLKMIGLLNELEATETIVKKSASFMTLYVEKGSTSKPQGGQKKKKTHKAKAIAPPTGGVKKNLRASVFIARCQTIRRHIVQFS
ncbi:hypothetical protein KY284_027194 [Solanum tuberosum]|nr:hypothetical protein KY284_027194 [Solanum tuberosum]